MSVRRRILTTGSRLLAAATVAATVLVPAAPAQAAPAFPFVGGFQLFNVRSDKCLTVAGGGTADNDVVVQSACRDERSHLWRMRLVTLTGLFQVQNVRSGRCLSANEGSGRVVQYRCDDAVSRRWRLWDAKGTGFYIRGAASGRCLTVAGGGVDENAAALLSTCGPARSRRWDARLSGSTERA
ncbi:RICIN domain-containing protein [Actinoplanes sp. ATCC 53533]|uniref:RICIN domain-containing protein n=1 Tax=Actinoplanes sp. ATCC 53533 TaxID=1288362 RepID=UPI0013157FE2|nr:RICIN domain-containing protein [Actinoplanes sp. ATCC 53533]